jgi:hypothetical protein
MPYHIPHFACGCGEIIPLDIMEKAHWTFTCPKCKTWANIEVVVPVQHLMKDAVQRAQVEVKRGKVE